MIRKILLGVSLIGAAFAGLDCNQIFGLHETEINRPNKTFAGCFRGPITEPAGPGVLTIVLVASPEATVNLEGCMQASDPRFDATVAGFVQGKLGEPQAEALVTVMPQGRPAFALTVERQPPVRFEDAITVTLVNETGFPFKRAATLPRCAAPTTCADLGIAVPFMPGGAP